MHIVRKVRSGFTLVEIMIVVAIIGLLAAVAIPNFVNARTKAQRTACISNLKLIEGAKEYWALERKKVNGDAVVEAEVNEFIKGNQKPECPGGGTYDYKPIGENPTCSKESDGHKM
jgi:prepilin-type N-terminal cleavage/methylation domain-containing protein